MKYQLSRPRNSVNSPHRFSRVAPAFTLVEMLVVISIITVLLTIGAMGLKNMSQASGVGAGLPVAEAIFSEARAIAVGKGTKTRVLIHAQNDRKDEVHRERFLRYMAIAYEELDEDGNSNWVIASKGAALPKGVYFSKELSEKSGLDIPTLTNPIELPGKSDSECYYYEFNAEGLMSEPIPSDMSVPSFVIVAGSLPPGQTEPIVKGKNMGGFVVWRSGRTSIFRHPDQIDSTL